MICPVDLLAKMAENETDAVMFPKGVRQLLGWAYSMAGVDPHEPTAHAKLIDKMDSGEVRPFSLRGINLSGLTELQKFGEAANLRMKVEEAVTEEQRHVIWARYCDHTVDQKMIGMIGVVEEVHGRLRRSRQLVADCVWHVVCTDKQRENCTLYAIGKHHGIGIMTVCRDVKKIRDYMREVEESAHGGIRNAFPGGDVV